jgi:hypothetical protein
MRRGLFHQPDRYNADNHTEDHGSELAMRSRSPYRFLTYGFIALVVCVAAGYLIGTKAAVNTLFNAWMIVTGVPATGNLLRFRDSRKPGAVPAVVIWCAWFFTVLILGGMVFGNKCPYISIPQLGTPGVN